ncbi:NAD-dependent epimerase/dehydratase family protein [Streptomyces sp. NPDC050145]|uniref:NAD-dependent epimerase/dehydratase family protein n=1 Tax=Streptomyces sp. NPDC050145 TaxID=3365602 RepID=UPI00379E2623
MNGDGLRIAVTGATGNLGTSVVRQLGEDPRVDSTLAIARRVLQRPPAKTDWAAVDLAEVEGDEVDRLFQGVDAVVHLAWRMQPSRDPVLTWRTNVLGSVRVLHAVAAARVPALVHASSVGAYSPGPEDRAVDESWPTHGWPEAAYCREKAYLERALDAFEQAHREVRVVRMRPAFMFKEGSASEQRRLFAGRFVPGVLGRPDLLPFLPDIPGFRVQTLHTEDAARAFVTAALGTARGPFNLAAHPVLDAHVLGVKFDARPVRLPRPLARSATAAAYGLRLMPSSPQLFDAVLRLPLMDCSRAHAVLGWQPRKTALAAVDELLHGMRTGAGEPTAPLRGSVFGT